MKIAKSVNLFGIVVGTGFAAVIGTSLIAIGELKVGGPVYSRIVMGKDLLADISPPPMYIVESYVEATMALNDPASLDSHRKRLEQLHQEYAVRNASWAQQNDLDPELKQKLTERSNAEVANFWQAVENDFLPALARDDFASAQLAYAHMSAAYAAHRAIIDEAVADARRINDLAGC